MLQSHKRKRVQFDCGTELITKQSFKDECDINNILSQFKRTGIIQHITQHQPQYQDLPDELDYQTSLNLMMTASNAFSTLPSVVRAYFDNDPARLLRALHDPDMRDKLTELGVLRAPDLPQPPGNPVVPPQPSVAPLLAGKELP